VTELLSDEQLIKRYVAAASGHRRATEEGNPRKANEQHDILAAAYRELRKRGLAAQRKLLPLLVHADVGVRIWAAAHALEFSPRDGEPVLVAIARLSGPIGFSAEMTLKEWRKGRLEFP